MRQFCYWLGIAYARLGLIAYFRAQEFAEQLRGVFDASLSHVT